MCQLSIGKLSVLGVGEYVLNGTTVHVHLYSGIQASFPKAVQEITVLLCLFVNRIEEFRDQVRSAEMWPPRSLKLDACFTMVLLIQGGKCMAPSSPPVHNELLGFKDQVLVGSPHS